MIIITIIIIISLLVIFSLRNMKATYVSEVVINKPYDEVWTWISNPSTYDKVYPHWVKSAQKVDGTIYHISDQFGGSYNVKLISDKNLGVVDLKIGEETSQTRLFDLDGKRTAIIHLAKRWKNLGFVQWFFHKIIVWRDFRNAKKVIEQR